MNATTWLALGTSAYILAFLATMFGLVVWRGKRRQEKTPESFVLLRGPGEVSERGQGK